MCIQDIYYTAPPEKAFKDVKKRSIELWQTMGDIGGYSSGKINRIKDLENIKDNFMYMIAMFDQGNQRLLAIRLSKDTRNEIVTRLSAVESYSTLIFV